MNRSGRELVGYLGGGLLVLVIVPSLLGLISTRLDRLFRIGPLLAAGPRYAIASILACGGFGLGLWSILEQRDKGQGGPLQLGRLEVSPKTRNLVVSGPYKYTRNPMLLGAFLLYLGFACFLGSLFALLGVLALIALMLRFAVRSEERRLAEDFGEAYEEYRNRTPRFLPRPRMGRKR